MSQFFNFQPVERQISTFNITWCTVNICWTAAPTFVAQQVLNRVSLALQKHVQKKILQLKNFRIYGEMQLV